MNEDEMGTNVTHDQVDVGHFAGLVADIAGTLESPHEAESRICHVLELVRRLVPCDRCALCTRPGGDECALAVVPDVPEPHRERLRLWLEGVLHLLDGGD